MLKNESYLAYLHEFLVPAVGHYGWAGDAFHTRRDGKKDMVTIIQKDQYVFGGYTEIPWGKKLYSL